MNRKKHARYLAYMKSDAWHRLRDAVWDRARGNCERCGARNMVYVVHRTSGRLYRERPEDLEGLCEACQAARWPAQPKPEPEPAFFAGPGWIIRQIGHRASLSRRDRRAATNRRTQRKGLARVTAWDFREKLIASFSRTPSE